MSVLEECKQIAMEKAGGFKHYQTWKLHILIENYI